MVENIAPPSTQPRGKERFVLETERPKLESRRMFFLATFSTAVAVVEGFALASLAPLKERVPYFVEVEESTGKVSVSEQAARKFVADEQNIRYFLREWTQNLLTVDQRSREFLLPASYAVLRGDALRQWTDWVEVRDKTLRRLADKPTYRREARLVSIVFIADGVALIRVLLTDSASTVRKQVTVHFSLIPPSSDEEAMANPLGLNITQFTIDDELA